MNYLIIILLFISQMAWGQLVNSVELAEKLTVTSEEYAKKELLHQATLKSLEKFVPELGYKYEEFNEKLNSQFNEYFAKYKEHKLVEKFGANYKSTMAVDEVIKQQTLLESDRHESFIRFSQTSNLLRSHSFAQLTQDQDDPTRWKAKVDVDVDKIKLDKLLRKIIKGESKPFQKILIITEIDPHEFSWTDLGLENENSFISPLNASWLKWFNDNLPTSVEEAVVCDLDCMNYYRKWSETHIDQIAVPEEYRNSVFLNIHMQVKRTGVLENIQETTFEWEGRTLIQDLSTKRTLESFGLPPEKRTFRQLDQKALNSGLASSLYRSPLTAFLQFKRKLEEKIGFNRVSKLVIKGHRNLGEVLQLNEMLKTRGTALGLEVFLENFSKDEANLLCFYRGEEKSFTDILSGLKGLKSTHSYTLVNEFTGVHHVIKFVTE